MNTSEPTTPLWFLLCVLTLPVVFVPGAVEPFEMPRWLLLGILALLLISIRGAGPFIKPSRWGPVHCLLLYGFAFSMIRTIASPSVPEAAHAALFAALWIVWNAFLVASDRARFAAMRWLVGMGIIQAIYGILQYAEWDPLFVRESWATGPRMAMAGTIGTPAIYGIFLGLAILAGLHCAGRSPRKRLYVAATILMGAALLLNNTRSAIVGTILGLMMLLLGRYGRKAWTALIMGAIMAGLFIAAVPGLRQRWLELADFRGTHSATIRNFYWKVTWEAILRRPLTGYGPGSFSRVYLDAQADLLANGRLDPPEVIQPMLWAHNDYLQAWAEYGLPGLLLFLWCIGWGLWRWRANSGRSFNEAGWLAAFTALFLFPFYHPSTLLTILWFYAEKPEEALPPNGERRP